MHVRPLTSADRSALDALLQQDPDVTLFQRSNLLRKGICNDGEPYSGLYVGAFEADALVSVCVHVWLNTLLVYAPRHAAALARALAAATDRPILGAVGPAAHVTEALAALTLGKRTFSSLQVRYGLALKRLRVPSALSTGRLRVRRATLQDVSTLARWQVAYADETLGEVPGPDAEAEAHANIVSRLPEGNQWVAETSTAENTAPRIVAMSRFNARVPDTVQIGGVFTPPASRSRGYGRAVVAGSLLTAQTEGVVRSVLFTEESNLAAQHAYEALGYERTGDFGIELCAP